MSTEDELKQEAFGRAIKVPKDFVNPYREELNLYASGCPENELSESIKVLAMKEEAFNLGAWAMLKGIRKQGKHFQAGEKFPILKDNITNPGTLVFVLDDRIIL